MRNRIRFVLHGKSVELADFVPTRTLLDWLREERSARGTKEGCNEGDCGACTVLLARVENGQLVHRPVNACITLLGMVDGAEVLTIEDVKDGDTLHPVQREMVQHHGSQCGFCTPGIVMSLLALHKAGGPITRERVAEQLQGNLCRCTGYRPILDAAIAALDGTADHLDAREPARIAALGSLEDGSAALVGDSEGFFAVPRSLEDALSLYAAHPDATILAGATDVGLWMTKQFRPIRKFIWLGRVSALQAIEETSDVLTLGAGVSHEAALPFLARLAPDLQTLGLRFGSRQVRAQGTVGGNIANGSPIGDWAPAFIALGGSVTLAHSKGSRSLPLEAFFIDYGKQDRKPGEIVTAVTLPKLTADTQLRCFKISKRFDEDISALMGAFCMTVASGRVTRARIAFGGMAATPRRAPATEAALVGISLTDQESWTAALLALERDYQPISDMRASARYRMETARALLTKALMELGGGTGTRISETLNAEALHAS